MSDEKTQEEIDQRMTDNQNAPSKREPGNVDQYHVAVANAEEQNKAPEPDQEVERARADGWAPLDQWRGDPNDWVDASEFNKRGVIIKQAHARANQTVQLQNQKIQQLEAAIEALSQANEQIIQKDTADVMNSLKEQRAEAISLGDGVKVNEIDDQIEKFKQDMSPNTEREQAIAEDTPERFPDEFYAFSDENTWYATQERVNAGADVDWEMTQMTDAIGASFYQAKMAAGEPEPTAAQALAHIKQRLQQIYPDRFTDNQQEFTPPPPPSQTRRQPPPVFEPSGEINANQRNLGNTPKVTVDSLPFDEQKMIRRMAESSGIDVQEYLDQMQRNG